MHVHNFSSQGMHSIIFLFCHIFSIHFPNSLEDLLEKSWVQTSNFLMEQAQHFDSKFKMH